MPSVDGMSRFKYRGIIRKRALGSSDVAAAAEASSHSEKKHTDERTHSQITIRFLIGCEGCGTAGT